MTSTLHWSQKHTLLPISGTNLTKLVNIDYLGTGYDVIVGDPHANEIDPGFRLSVVQLSYNVVSQST